MVPAHTSLPGTIPSWWLNIKMFFFRFGIVMKRLWWIPLLTVSIGLAGAAVVYLAFAAFLSLERPNDGERKDQHQ